MLGAAGNAPKQDIANVSGYLLGIRVEAVRCGPNVADIASSRQWEDAQILNLLTELSVETSLVQ